MGLFTSKKYETLEELFIAQIEDLYDAEQRLTKALPKMRDAATDAMLKEAFSSHLVETERQVERLEEVFRLIGKSPKAETCEAMKGLLKEGEEMLDAKGNADVLDAGLIAAAQRVEHYEMAGYGTARALANRLGHRDAAELLGVTLEEEANADRKLSSVAETHSNVTAPK
ncbi:ferritin-like domain-containing protein [Bremerella alba]|uniref:Protein YciF n=1 Tax=Bremerella alba TaxID=980252 RepID=A0A7V8V7A2_9BACT|nr:ferritin-like domain-containing protein [Bremerella alba]MBA2116279.1 Protein YciF [Bremerella alba]